jgi:hypothetical protein
MTGTSEITYSWPDAIVDIGPIELSAAYWGVVGLIPYDGHVVLAHARPPGRKASSS